MRDYATDLQLGPWHTFDDVSRPNVYSDLKRDPFRLFLSAAHFRAI